MRYFVIGCAGFIGSHLTDQLLKEGHEAIGYDHFSTGIGEFLEGAAKSPNFTLIKADLTDRETLTKTMKGIHAVFHLAANADVRFGLTHPPKDLEQNLIVTSYVLEAMRANDVRCIAFASTGSIYDEATVIPTPENAPFPIQTSLYGASKRAAGDFIQAYCEGFHFHGHVFDLGTDVFCHVADPINWTGHFLGVSPRIFYDGDEHGWIGNNPFIFLDCSLIRNLGWRPKLSIQESVTKLRYRHITAHRSC